MKDNIIRLTDQELATVIAVLEGFADMTRMDKDYQIEAARICRRLAFDLDEQRKQQQLGER